jgi:hypothetical protein
VDLKIGDMWVGFEPTNYDINLPATHDRSMMIFNTKSATHYDDMLRSWRVCFPELKSTKNVTVNVKPPRVAIGLTQEHVEALDNTTSKMGIHSCGKQYKVTSAGSGQRINQIDPISFHDNVTTEMKADLFPIDPEQKIRLLNETEKRKLFSRVLTIQQVSGEINSIKRYITETMQDLNKETQDFLLGLIAHSLYTSLKWRLAQQPSFQCPVHKVSLSYDIDQVSLDVRDIGTLFSLQLYDNNCPFRSNFGFLQYHFDIMINSVSVILHYFASIWLQLSVFLGLWW